MEERKIEDMCVVCNDHNKPSCGYEERGIQRKCPYNDFIDRGYELAEKDLGWHSVDECLPEIDEEVIVLTDELGTAPIYKIGFGHIVKPATYKLKIDSEIKEFTLQNHDGWNIPGVKFWMPMPKIPNEE